MENKNRGFTLIELMITLAIIGIIAAIAIPSYMDYTKRAKLGEAVQAVAPYKLAIATCYQSTDDLAQCETGEHGVPAALTGDTAYGIITSLDTASASANSITIEVETSVASDDEPGGVTYELIGTGSNGVITWASSGSAVTAGYVGG